MGLWGSSLCSSGWSRIKDLAHRSSGGFCLHGEPFQKLKQRSQCLAASGFNTVLMLKIFLLAAQFEVAFPAHPQVLWNKRLPWRCVPCLPWEALLSSALILSYQDSPEPSCFSTPFSNVISFWVAPTVFALPMSPMTCSPLWIGILSLLFVAFTYVCTDERMYLRDLLQAQRKEIQSKGRDKGTFFANIQLLVWLAAWLWKSFNLSFPIKWRDCWSSEKLNTCSREPACG